MCLWQEILKLPGRARGGEGTGETRGGERREEWRSLHRSACLQRLKTPEGPVKNGIKACTQHLQSNCLPLDPGMTSMPHPFSSHPIPPASFPLHPSHGNVSLLKTRLEAPGIKTQDIITFLSPSAQWRVGHEEPGFTFQSFMHKCLLETLQPSCALGLGDGTRQERPHELMETPH